MLLLPLLLLAPAVLSGMGRVTECRRQTEAVNGIPKPPIVESGYGQDCPSPRNARITERWPMQYRQLTRVDCHDTNQSLDNKRGSASDAFLTIELHFFMLFLELNAAQTIGM
ncbi:hypothetical protein B0H66DRAFT_530366 [Apodospora peruviana]|uniref:Secreted protein n=1 Tax=Apodospora peruviana TaxID=516989 RepID=A0AAE0MBR4_9PEZI|nr:hypothetical protein B0H66DRAFT_530366 [Apodospora peruviana]